jgi:hypothetical protein
VRHRSMRIAALRLTTPVLAQDQAFRLDLDKLS